MTTHSILIKLVSVERYEARLGGELLCVSRTPFLSAARALLARGHPPTDKLEMRRRPDEPAALTSTIGAAAKLTVWETPLGPVFGPYRTNPRLAGGPKTGDETE